MLRTYRIPWSIKLSLEENNSEVKISDGESVVISTVKLGHRSLGQSLCTFVRSCIRSSPIAGMYLFILVDFVKNILTVCHYALSYGQI